MDNVSFRSDDLPSYADVNRIQNATYPGSDSKAKARRRDNACTRVQKSLQRACNGVKNSLQGNKYTRPFFPPSGTLATVLTLALTTVIVFVSARVVMGKIADIGGTIFALLLLILLALVGGKVITLLSMGCKKMCGVDIQMPPLLGMLIVGIILKNVPYNFGQFGRAECQQFDSLHTGSGVALDDPTDEGFAVDLEDIEGPLSKEGEDPVVARIIRSASIDSHGGHDDHHDEGNSSMSKSCEKKFFGHDLDPFISRTLRSICLTVILLMAGLELDPQQLLKLSGVVVRATFIPCLTEAVAVAVLSKLLLGFPWTVGFMLGFILAAVSPAVIIPCLMSLSGRGYGVAKGVPTLVIAACAADDVVAISGFGIFLGVTFSVGAPLWKLILHGPIEVVLGVSFGVFWGILAQWIPNKDHRHVAFFRYVLKLYGIFGIFQHCIIIYVGFVLVEILSQSKEFYFRWLILFGGGLIALFGAHMIHYDGAGGLATIIMAFVAGMQWRKQGWGDHNPVTKTFQRMWIILQPVIFALIGTEIQVDKINLETLGYSILVLVIALVIRMIGTYTAVLGAGLNTKEKIFMAFAWLPKATVQAALGPIFLDNVLRYEEIQFDRLGDRDEWIAMGNDILTLAVLSILITAPLGAVSILALGPRLLERDENFKRDDDDDGEEMNERDLEEKPSKVQGRKTSEREVEENPEGRRTSVSTVSSVLTSSSGGSGFN